MQASMVARTAQRSTLVCRGMWRAGNMSLQASSTMPGLRTAAAPVQRPRHLTQQQQRQAPAAPRAEAAAAGAGSIPTPEPAGQQQQQHRKRRPTSLVWLVGSLAAAAVLGGAHWVLSHGAITPLLESARAAVAGSVLGRSGFFAAFSLIFLSEIGDKTFFIAALLAMRLGRWISWAGSTASLAVMTVISVGIGFAVKSVPAVVESSEVLGQWLGALLLLYFGLRTLRDAWSQPDDSDAGDELEEAEASVSQAEQGGKISSQQTPWQALFEVASLIFVAEWGDRSMLATIALGAAQSPLGVAGGAIMAHAVATLLAVAGGAALSKHISEKMVGYIGGGLFLVFSAATMLGLF